MAVTKEQVYGVLRECYDPEIPVNIVDLGLVYDVALVGASVKIKMTLTYPGCGMAQQITESAQKKIAALPGVAAVNVQLVFDPPWSQALISAEGRKTLGME